MSEPSPTDSSRVPEPRPAAAGTGSVGATRALRVVGVVVLFFVAALSVRSFWAWRAAHEEVDRLLAETGLARRAPEAAVAIDREPDPEMAELAIARALVAESLDYTSFRTLPLREAMEEVTKTGDRLELAERIASKILAHRPSSWEAAMVLGGARYMMLSRNADPRLIDDRESWERPLQQAVAMAPDEEEPLNLLVGARLEVWSILSDAEQRETRGQLRRVFADPSTFARLIPAWLEIASSPEDAFALVPDVPEAWRLIERIYSERRDWTRTLLARERWRIALNSDLAHRLAETERLLRGGEIGGARAAALAIVESAPVAGTYRSTIERALELCPPNPGGSSESAAFVRWLEWSNDAYLRGQRQLASGVVWRLIEGVAEPLASEAALAALSVDDLPRAEHWERMTEALNLEVWGRYCLAKARYLAKRRETIDAKKYLELANRSWRGSPLELAARLAVAEASADAVQLVEAREAWQRAALDVFPATAWRWRGNSARLDFVVANPALGVAIAVESAPVTGAIVEVRTDGDTTTLRVVEPGQIVEVEVQLGPGARTVEINPVAGGRVVPGEVTLLR